MISRHADGETARATHHDHKAECHVCGTTVVNVITKPITGEHHDFEN
jgi:hypothetical protein